MDDDGRRVSLAEWLTAWGLPDEVEQQLMAAGIERTVDLHGLGSATDLLALGLSPGACKRLLTALGRDAEANAVQVDQAQYASADQQQSHSASDATDVKSWLMESGFGEDAALARSLAGAGVERMVDMCHLTRADLIALGCSEDVSDRLDAALMDARRRFSVDLDALDWLPPEPVANIRRGMTNRRLTGGEI